MKKLRSLVLAVALAFAVVGVGQISSSPASAYVSGCQAYRTVNTQIGNVNCSYGDQAFQALMTCNGTGWYIGQKKTLGGPWKMPGLIGGTSSANCAVFGPSWYVSNIRYQY